MAPVSYPTIQYLKSASNDVTAPYFSVYVINSVLLEIIKTLPSDPPIINTYELCVITLGLPNYLVTLSSSNLT